MRKAILALLIVACLSSGSSQVSAQHGDIDLIDSLSYLIDYGRYSAVSDQAVDSSQLEPSLPEDQDGDTNESGSMPVPQSEPELELESRSVPDFLDAQTVSVDASLDDTASLPADWCNDSGDETVKGPRKVDVEEEACYVRVMSDGRASVREIRSLDLCAGSSSLRLTNLPTSIVENSIFLSVWNAAVEVEISGYRLVHTEDSATLYVDTTACDNVLGASLEVNYITDDLLASLSYSGLFNGDTESLCLSEWLTVANDSGKRFENAIFSFRLAELGFGHSIPSSVTLPSGEKRLFLSNEYVLSPARTVVSAENDPDTGLYDVTELIKVEGLQDRGLLIPSSPVTIYSMDPDGFVSLNALGSIYKPREYSWFTVQTLDQPDVTVQRAKTSDEVTSTGGIRDVSYMINIDNNSSDPVVVTIYEYMGPGNWIVISATVDAKPISHSRDLSRREYATFTIEVPADSSRALFYRARIDDR